MQIVMIAVLGATVGVAALVDRHRHEMRQIPLDPPIACGPILVQLPHGATVTISSQSPGLLTAAINETYPAERQVFVTVAAPAEPGLLEQLLEAKEPSREEQNVPFGKDGTTGQLYIWSALLHHGDYEMAGVQVIATAQLKSADGAQVTIRSNSLGVSEDLQTQADMDVELVKQIAASVVRREETAGF